ncbi:hypothetical protein [Thiocystis violacea]|uniref:hypothetical protein n=1 Tax=Thiocystis violacea TaxID=13725 RepID=UPI001F5B8E25|nr:hypothetical protein [Thiocystis violacea]
MIRDDEILPLQARIETVTDDADLEAVYNTERHRLLSLSPVPATGSWSPVWSRPRSFSMICWRR